MGRGSGHCLPVVSTTDVEAGLLAWPSQRASKLPWAILRPVKLKKPEFSTQIAVFMSDFLVNQVNQGPEAKGRSFVKVTGTCCFAAASALLFLFPCVPLGTVLLCLPLPGHGTDGPERETFQNPGSPDPGSWQLL